MNQKAAPPLGEEALDPKPQPGQGAISEPRGASPGPASDMRASRDMVT